MNLLEEISFGKSYADFIPTKKSTNKSSKMSDRRSPVPPACPVPQVAPQQAEPTREYDIIDDDAVASTEHGVTSGSNARLGRRVLGQVGQSLHASADMIFRKGGYAGEDEDATQETQSNRSIERDKSECVTALARHPVMPGESEREVHDQLSSHGNEMEFGSAIHEPEPDVPALNLPHVNCPEKIVICIDLATEVNRLPFVTKDGSAHQPLEMIKKALNLFVETKSAINAKHEFALVLLQESALWIQDFTSDVDEFVNVLLDLTNDTTECERCDLSSLFDVIHEKVQPPVIDDIECLPPPYIIRTLFVYGRSNCIPELNGIGENDQSQMSLSSSPYFFFDVFYVHEPPTEDNFCKEIYDVFLNLDIHNTSYIHEVGRDSSMLRHKMAMLIAHPLQRPQQTQCEYKIFRDE
ncbi:BRISC and BRCA1-A complex member 1-like [Patiria miniata]|uniref:BRISC and BRCA1-A complex member 1 n=1 Tax=Patiria miniata TaxID=46514 RepID=A0A914AW63_PATMI|nr:BRISC and BRCA1-A complex member 1-like [Patiria miniata]